MLEDSYHSLNKLFFIPGQTVNNWPYWFLKSNNESRNTFQALKKLKLQIKKPLKTIFFDF